MSGQFCTLAIFYNSIPLLSFSQQTSMKPNDICQIVSVALREKEAWKIKSATFPVRACKILEKKTKVLHCKSKRIQMNMAPKVQECKGTQIQKFWIWPTQLLLLACLLISSDFPHTIAMLHLSQICSLHHEIVICICFWISKYWDGNADPLEDSLIHPSISRRA